jgi:hypothetical protein
MKLYYASDVACVADDADVPLQDMYLARVNSVRGSFRSAVRPNTGGNNSTANPMGSTGSRANFVNNANAIRVPLPGLTSQSTDSSFASDRDRVTAEYKAATARMDSKRRSHPPSSSYASSFTSQDYNNEATMENNYPSITSPKASVSFNPNPSYSAPNSNSGVSVSSSAATSPTGAAAEYSRASHRGGEGKTDINAGHHVPSRRVGSSRARVGRNDSGMHAPAELPPIVRHPTAHDLGRQSSGGYSSKSDLAGAEPVETIDLAAGTTLSPVPSGRSIDSSSPATSKRQPQLSYEDVYHKAARSNKYGHNPDDTL